MQVKSATVATTAPLPTPPGLAKPAQGHAYGMLKKLGTDHFHATAQARLMAKFGHLLPTPAPVEPDPGSVDTGSTTPPDSVTDPVTAPVTDSGASLSAGTTLDVVA